jgi:hypothetical protein
MDFCVVATVSSQLLYVWFVIDHEHRRLIHFNSERRRRKMSSGSFHGVGGPAGASRGQTMIGLAWRPSRLREEEFRALTESFAV